MFIKKHSDEDGKLCIFCHSTFDIKTGLIFVSHFLYFFLLFKTSHTRSTLFRSEYHLT